MRECTVWQSYAERRRTNKEKSRNASNAKTKKSSKLKQSTMWLQIKLYFFNGCFHEFMCFFVATFGCIVLFPTVIIVYSVMTTRPFEPQLLLNVSPSFVGDKKESNNEKAQIQRGGTTEKTKNSHKILRRAFI